MLEKSVMQTCLLPSMLTKSMFIQQVRYEHLFRTVSSTFERAWYRPGYYFYLLCERRALVLLYERLLVFS